MQRIRATAPLDCTKERAEALLTEFFNTRRASEGPVRMTLSVALDDLGVRSALAVAHDVDIRVERRRDEDNLNDEYGIQWSPTGGGPFPEFRGRLIVWAEEDPSNAYLELDGTYEPPLGSLVGEAFDAVLGRKIAEATAKRFAATVAEGVSALNAAS